MLKGLIIALALLTVSLAPVPALAWVHGIYVAPTLPSGLTVDFGETLTGFGGWDAGNLGGPLSIVSISGGSCQAGDFVIDGDGFLSPNNAARNWNGQSTGSTGYGSLSAVYSYSAPCTVVLTNGVTTATDTITFNAQSHHVRGLPASITATGGISGNQMTVTATAGMITPDTIITSGAQSGTRIVKQISATGSLGNYLTGVYQVYPSQSVAPGTALTIGTPYNADSTTGQSSSQLTFSLYIVQGDSGYRNVLLGDTVYLRDNSFTNTQSLARLDLRDPVAGASCPTLPWSSNNSGSGTACTGQISITSDTQNTTPVLDADGNPMYGGGAYLAGLEIDAQNSSGIKMPLDFNYLNFYSNNSSVNVNTQLIGFGANAWGMTFDHDTIIYDTALEQNVVAYGMNCITYNYTASNAGSAGSITFTNNYLRHCFSNSIGGTGTSGNGFPYANISNNYFMDSLSKGLGVPILGGQLIDSNTFVGTQSFGSAHGDNLIVSVSNACGCIGTGPTITHNIVLHRYSNSTLATMTETSCALCTSSSPANGQYGGQFKGSATSGNGYVTLTSGSAPGVGSILSCIACGSILPNPYSITGSFTGPLLINMSGSASGTETNQVYYTAAGQFCGSITSPLTQIQVQTASNCGLSQNALPYGGNAFGFIWGPGLPGQTVTSVVGSQVNLSGTVGASGSNILFVEPSLMVQGGSGLFAYATLTVSGCPSSCAYALQPGEGGNGGGTSVGPPQSGGLGFLIGDSLMIPEPISNAVISASVASTQGVSDGLGLVMLAGSHGDVPTGVVFENNIIAPTDGDTILVTDANAPTVHNNDALIDFQSCALCTSSVSIIVAGGSASLWTGGGAYDWNTTNSTAIAATGSPTTTLINKFTGNSLSAAQAIYPHLNFLPTPQNGVPGCFVTGYNRANAITCFTPAGTTYGSGVATTALNPADNASVVSWATPGATFNPAAMHTPAT